VADINGSVSGVFARYVQFIGTWPMAVLLCGKCFGGRLVALRLWINLTRCNRLTGFAFTVLYC